MAALALVLGLLGCSGDPDPAAVDAAGLSAQSPEASDAEPAPDFELSDLEGNRVSLASFRGRTLLLDFWATWCAPCVFQIPVLNEFYLEHKDEGVAVLGISIDVDPEEVIPPFLEENPTLYPVLLGDEALARRYGAPGFPALVVVDPEGRIVYLHVGLADEEDLEAVLARISEGSAGT